MMREIIPADEILNKAHSIGQYYGFTPLSNLTAQRRGTAKEQSAQLEKLSQIPLDPIAETVVSLLKQCRNIEHIPSPRQPLFVWHTNLAPGRQAQKKAVVQFHSIGSDRSIADAVVIRAITALVRDLYREEPVLRINSMGDKETRARYARELGVFFKKHSNDLPEECILRSRDNTFEAAELAIEKECANNMPSPTDNLSDASRKRFEDLLEYLEMTETPYELARTLISRGNAWNDVCFEILVGNRRVAWGSRYNELAKHFFKDSPLTAIGAVVQMTTDGSMIKNPPKSRIKFAFVHIGDEAKKISVKVAEELRKARVPLVQHIGVESLTEQMRLADHIDSPYLIIMGRKEALEGSAILRNRATQVETTLSLNNLINHLKQVV